VTVVLTDRGWPDADIERSLCEKGGHPLVDVQEQTDEAALVAAVKAADPVGLLFNWAPVTASVLDAAPRLRVAARLGVGLDNIDLAAAARRRITVTRVPDYCVEEVSDHVVALVHAWARGVVAFDRAVRAGQWAPGSRSQRRVRDLSIGVWGLGAIGSRVAAKFVALGCTVRADDRHSTSTPAGVAAAPVAELLATSDVITLHMPAQLSGGAVVDEGVLAAMRPGSLLVNTARGSLVDLDALVAGLRIGRPGSAALDVLPNEPFVPPALVDGEVDVILTPHVAFSSTASVAELRQRATEDLLRVLRGEPARDPVNLSSYTGGTPNR
jgi:D-3-phosphoglycerate dehydrogenase